MLDHLLAEGFASADGDLLMTGPAAETVFGGAHRRRSSASSGAGRDYRAVTPDGEEVGRLDARFAKSDATGAFSLGGKGWNVIGRDDAHGLLIVEPGSGGGSRRAFWSGERGGASAARRRRRRSDHRGARHLAPARRRRAEALADALAAIPGRRRARGQSRSSNAGTARSRRCS